MLAALEDRPALSFLRSFRLTRLEEQRAELTVEPGQRQLIRFAEAKRAEIERLLGEAAGRRVEVRFAEPPEGELAAAEPEARSPAPGSEREQAYSLPLVRALMEHFDLRLQHVERRKDGEAAEPEPEPGEADA